MIKRLDRLDVATSDLTDAAEVYERNFGFSVRREPGSDEAIVTVGGSEIRLQAGETVAEILAAAGEGRPPPLPEAYAPPLLAVASGPPGPHPTTQTRTD